MPIPTHSIFCITKAFKTNCPDCKSEVWFFSCNCGSKVYFNDLGEPWPIHQCRYRLVREVIEMLRINDRLSDSEIYKKVDNLAAQRNFEISQEVLDMLELELGKRKKPFQVIKVKDLQNYTDISGKIMQLNRQVSFRARLNIDLNNPLNIAFAGDLLKHEFAEVVIRENPDSNNHSKEFSVFIKSSLLRNTKLSIGKTLLATLKPISNKITQVWEIVEFKEY